MSHPTAAATELAPDHAIEVRERGADRDGIEQWLDGRLFMQLLVVDSEDSAAASAALQRQAEQEQIHAVCYADVNRPSGLALLTWSDEPADFVRRTRALFGHTAMRALRLRQGWSMLGRTYSTGYEPDLHWMLMRRPVETVLHAEHPWAIWYPLRRRGEFARLPGRDQGGILREHAHIGRAYGERDLAHDVRLACHGLDEHDNDFVIGLIGKELQPLSHVVQSMRKTRQTAEYIAQMGPFFVGYVLWRLAG